ncbi:MAG TPA: alanine--tRNA ligase [Candidatus Hydrogenedentes bacterium]|nr:alanine--tRNA ligase [Candidatus Hydrogenedentota bacterium]HRT19227.1 alanine--tRNA ligase [Candidatus Hydrogenedentota bacterium]HRT63307.1 alanine--tRNA ligase [Candidatus Hydrogenedentota bacterium]
MKSDEIRASYLEFFRERGHVIERSDTIVPSNDPTLLFSSAGMVQFKPYYTGEVPVPYRRAATSQKCLRAGGKANDLDEVGKTSRHLTFFEMLGNFSFGDYFKREAIAWAWEYSTQILKLAPDRIWVSVYEEDDEAFGIWEKEVGIPSHKIIRLGKKDNFWGPAGDTGACGPCSELHIDRGAELGCGRPDCAPGCEHCERFLEFWNLVFPQYDQQLDGSRPPLKNRGIDTGMGLERVAALLQKKETVFDTDGIYPIIEATQALCKVKYESNPVPFRVIADHARALSFMIADGVLPSNEGRGYVERRLLRRAARFGRELGFEKPFLHEVTKTVVERMGHHYQELIEKRLQIEKIILTEEERFAGTLARGMDRLEEVFESMKKAGDKTVPGAELFRLHDTFGFPLDLATDIAVDRGFAVDREGFDTAMAKQREQARTAWAGSGEEALAPIYRVVADEEGPTEFVGYETLQCPARIVAIIQNGKRIESLEEGAEGEIVLDTTPFYAESGGQIGDTGTIETADGSAHVSITKAPLKKVTLHGVRVNRGILRQGDTVSACVDAGKRRATENHHTATHLLQAALQDVLGDHVHQAGSLVTPERLRFDFTHFEAIGPERLYDIERLANAYIRTDTPVNISYKPIAEARQAGAMALFGEKYEDIVRVVQIGDISMELCGGCHVRQTGVIGYLKILSESSIAAGVRRIEAVCGEPAVEMIQARDRQLAHSAHLLNAPLDELHARIQAMLEENKRLTREVAKWKQAAVSGAAVDYMSRVREVKGIKVLASEVEGQDAAGLRMALDNLRDKLGSGVVVLGSAVENKVFLCVGVTKDLTARVKAGEIIKNLAPIVGGGGGGKPDMAQAGGKHPEKLPEAIGKAVDIVDGLLG